VILTQSNIVRLQYSVGNDQLETRSIKGRRQSSQTG